MKPSLFPLIDQLVHLGVTHFCICPGSRSTELTVALARHPKTETHVFHDERSAAFCALGFGKSGTLAALVTTSGTAVANAYPAVIEANMANIPLLIISADRPPELRSTNANQTIDQIKFFGDQVRFFFDIPCIDESTSLHSIQNTLCFAVSKCHGSNAGPVHLNWMFREPFLTNPAETIEHTNGKLFPAHQQGRLSATLSQLEEIQSLLETAQNGLLVFAELNHPSEIAVAQQIMNQSHWAMLVDPSSGLSLVPHPHRILAWEHVLSSPPLEFNPDIIVQLGNNTCSKRYEMWLQTLTCPILVLHDRPISSNPGSVPIQRFYCSLESIEGTLLSYVKRHLPSIPSLVQWTHTHNQRVQALLDEAAEQFTEWNEIHILQTIVDTLPTENPHPAQLFIGNSMPIRDLSNYVQSSSYHPVTCNRGASGIDGIPSTAYGWMMGSSAPTLLVLGDVSLMHDIGVLLTLANKPLTQPLIIVVINNGGGGIFSMLPIQQEQDVFEEYFATAHSHQLTPIVQSMGIACTQVQELEDLRSHIHNAFYQKTHRLIVIEALTHRSHNKALHQFLRQQLQQGWSQ